MTLRMPDNEHNDDRTYRWKQGGIPISAQHQPLQSTLSAQVYGERMHRMRLLLYDGPEELTEGMGLCVYVDPSASCDFRIIKAVAWDGVQRCDIEFIPEVMRA